MTDPRRARLEALAQWARDLPDLDTDEATEALVEVMGGRSRRGSCCGGWRAVRERHRPPRKAP